MAVNFMVGFFYMFSSMYLYVASYLRLSDKSIDLDGKNVLVIMPVWIMCQCLTSLVSIKVAERVGFWSLNLIAFVWFSLNHLLIAQVTSFYGFVIVYGVFNGLAMGLGFLPALYISWTYYPTKKSIVTGCVVFCSGISACILSPIITHLVNPDNLNDHDPEVAKRVPYMFRCLALVFSSITLVACLL